MGNRRIEALKAQLEDCLPVDRVRIERRLEALRRRRQPARKWHQVLDRLSQEALRSQEIRKTRERHFGRIRYPSELPITGFKEEILEALRQHQVIVVAGETGSGKTTQIPKIAREAGRGIWGRIGCTQPRRIAALSVSRRLAEELGATWGHEVGCKIRFQDASIPETGVKLMTDGILLAEIQNDPDLLEYDTLILDEAHERSLNIDFLLGYLRKLLPRRPDLKLVISSATIDTATFSRAFGDAPIVEVSGRLYPVEVRHTPVEAWAREGETEPTYVDAAVEAASRVVRESSSGDILIFMPGERDIRETRDQLEGRRLGPMQVVPLFGRLSAKEQERIFARGSSRKIVVATNIAETSITIPGIRYVIDSGLARVSRYQPGTRTHRLPIEPVAQSSADQRRGRAGRVAEGVCIRLYSQADYDARPRYGQPEIQRSNLAEVILRMKAFGLGEIEEFPFIEPPQAQAIQSGYQLLQELGALDRHRELTRLGKRLARLPIDPTMGRMILQAGEEGAPAEVLIIAAGLSIQDPRERPFDNEQEADQAHKPFLDPDSDFLTLLHLWNAFHAQWEKTRTQNQLRKFCRTNFLSYQRMREWVDTHQQLRETLDEMGVVPEVEPRSNPPYAAIHRSILSGLLGHIAERTERNLYRGAGNRKLMVFPASSLFDRRGSGNQRSGRHADDEERKRPSPNPGWIVAGEVVETSRLFARTVAGIDPEWAIELGGHLCRTSYGDPQWSAKEQRVIVRERVRLYGLELRSRWIPYRQINAKEATALFIQSALVEGGADRSYRFLEHNRRLRHKLETCQTRLRAGDLPDLDRALFAFYADRIEDVSSAADLDRLLKTRQQDDPNFLLATERDLLGAGAAGYDVEAFPDSVVLGGQRVELDYTYAPGQEKDGVTIKLPIPLAESLPPAAVEWAVPGLRVELVGQLIRSLPKSYRRHLVPIPGRAREIAGQLKPREGRLVEVLSRHLRDAYGIEVPVEAWRMDEVPAYLRPRVEALGGKGRPVVSGRDPAEVADRLERGSTEASVDWEAWNRAAARWEKYELTSWSFGDLPERVEISTEGQGVVCGFPGLEADNGVVNVRLFRHPREAQRRSRQGFEKLCERALGKELAWLQKDLGQLDRLAFDLAPPGSSGDWRQSAYENIRAYLFRVDPLLPLTREKFEGALARARERLPGLLPQFVDRVKAILELRRQITRHPSPYPGMKEETDALVPADFLRRIPYERLAHLPRYLKAKLTRADRAKVNPPKDREKAGSIRPYLEALRRLDRELTGAGNSGVRAADPDRIRVARQELFWMIEEYRVSCFAPELGTAHPVSAARLDRKLREIERGPQAT